ncbi:hypothetical protein vseg_002366 [Gypsophila vaccaria]
MASSPDSQPETPPAPVIGSVPSLVPPLPSIESPPLPITLSPPPVDDSPPPPTPSAPDSAPPPTTSSPPFVIPASPPPAPNASPPPSPVESPPTPVPDASPPPVDSSPPPAVPSSPDQSPPTDVAPPPPQRPRTPSPPFSPDSPPASPDSPPDRAPPPLTPAFTPPPLDPSSPPAPPDSKTSPPGPPTNTSTPILSPPKAPSKPGTPGSNAAVSSTPGPPTPSDNSDQAVRTGVAIGVVAAVVIIGFMLTILCMQRRKRKHSRYNSVYMLPSPYSSSHQISGSSFMKTNSSTGGGGGIVSGEYMGSDTSGLGGSKSWFSYEELTTATNGFASQNILGAGGFGCVYKGLLQDGREVAVKKLKDNSGQGDREFKAEVEIISRVHHRYLVSLVGYCITDYQRLLVYEYVPNGTLHYHLHSSSKPPMEWPHRVRVASGSARGIAYLHEDCHPKIIHRDIKSANILVENNFEAKVADFGLAKLAGELDSNTHISTRVMGTFGYMAPEYASSGKLTEKSDVFSFGVVLLEIITGRKPVDESRPLGDESLVEWARPLMTEALERENFDELADPKLQGNYDRGEMFRLIEAAAACVRHSATKRPKMSQVVRAMDTMSELSDLSNGMKPGESGIYNSREQSAQIRMFQRMAFGSQEFSSEAYTNSQAGWTNGGRSGQVGGRSGQVL